jgi:hypothetical protein
MSIESVPDLTPIPSPRPRRRRPRRRAHPPWDRQATKIKNGSALVAGVSQSIGYIRRLRELLADYSADLPEATAAERSLIRRVCIIELEIERLETKLASADEASQRNLDLYGRMTGNLRRVLQTLGLGSKRQLKHERDNATGPLGRLLIAEHEAHEDEEEVT